MKKSLLAVAVTAALPVIAQAQTNVTLFGRLDAAVEYIKPGTNAAGVTGGSALRLSEGVNSPSRFGVRGTEDLGGGLKGIFWLEQGFNVDTGTIGTQGFGQGYPGTATGGAMWTRRSYLGLEGGFGTLKLGREYSPAFWPWLTGDQMGLGYYGSLLFGQSFRLGDDVRFSNGIHYESPSLGGVKVRAAYAFGEQTVATPTQQKSAGNQLGVAIEYTGGPIYVGYGHHQTTANALTGNHKLDLLAAKFTFGMFNVTAGGARVDPAGDTNNTTSYWVSFGGDTGPHSYGVQAIRAKTDAPAGTKPTSTTYGLRYGYSLSKRTQLYATAGKVNNNATGTAVLGGSSSPVFGNGAGSDPQGIALGVAHNF